MKSLYPIGELPPQGELPPKMYAQVIRADRYGPPRQAFRVEVVDTPAPGPDEAIVAVMAAGVNYNNAWAALGTPLDVIASRIKVDPKQQPFHIGGSDASGIVYAVGAEVTNVKVGDRVVAHCGVWDRNDPWIKAGNSPLLSNSYKIWGYDVNWGSFAQFTKVQAHQLLPKPEHLSWEASAAYMLVGATAHRMLLGWAPHTVQEGDVVLVWGGTGGLGTQGIQIVRAMGGRPVAVVSNDDKMDYCKRLGAVGCVNRKRFTHWGLPPHWTETDKFNQWSAGARAFGKAIWDAVGEKKNPRIVLEHPGENTVPTSIFVVENGGMVVICAGTTGYNAVVDLRYLWMRQKRLQGSHFADDAHARALNELVIAGKVDPCLSRTMSFDEIPLAHQMMYDNTHPYGNMACLIGAPRPGMLDLH